VTPLFKAGKLLYHIMTNREETTTAMYGLVQAFLNKNRGLFNGFMRLSNEIDRFTRLRAGLRSLTHSITTSCEDPATVPGAASAKRTAAAIKTAVAAIEGSLAIIDDLIASEYTDSHPKLVKEYDNYRCIAESGA
jgi:hypothetical protein